jgi:glycosyltransferase involved in cell wall biosynthesis
MPEILPISVVVPTFNRKATILRCLRSILDGVCLPAEVVVVDDGSSDGTVDVVMELGDPRVRVILQERNGGAQAARNRGIAESGHDWIAFLDSDDEWVPNKLQWQWQQLSVVGFPRHAVLHGDCLVVRDGIVSEWKLPKTHGPAPIASVLRSPGPMFQALLVSHLHLQSIGGVDESIFAYQEWDTAIRLAREGEFYHERRPLFRYHIHGGSSISGDLGGGAEGYWQIISKHEQAIRKIDDDRSWNEHMLKASALALAGCRIDLEAEALHRSSGGIRVLLLTANNIVRTFPASRRVVARALNGIHWRRSRS